MFVLGSNGTGKSNLMHRIYGKNTANARWISAHRQTWFTTSMPELSSRSRWDTERNLQQNDMQPQARWRDYAGSSRPNIAMFDLIQKQNLQDREIAAAVREGESDKAQKLAKKNKNPLETLNELLTFANLPIAISLGNNDEVLATRYNGEPYSVAEASDGERNVILIAAEVLTVTPGTLVLIDEPERHLHRSIISPLLNGLFSERKDCTFVISTHDVSLVLDNAISKVLLVRGCTYQGKTVLNWDADLVEPNNAIDEELNKQILGSRRDVIFVEGETSSLDLPLYSLVFPDVSVIPKGSRKNVEDAVSSIRASEKLHWIRAYGIVDSDVQEADNNEQPSETGVYPIDAYSVESIYYDFSIQEEVARKRTDITGDDVFSRLEPARTAALNAIKENLENLSERAAERKLREEIFRRLPTRKLSPFEEPLVIDLNTPAILSQERQSLEKDLAANDLEKIIRRYPVRETPALARIATQLGFDSRKEYEKAVLQLLKEDEEMLGHVRGLLGNLPSHISAKGH